MLGNVRRYNYAIGYGFDSLIEAMRSRSQERLFHIVKHKPIEVMSLPAKNGGLTRCLAWKWGWDFPILPVIG